MVSVDVLKSVILEREEELFSKIRGENIIERDCLEKVKKLVSTDSALIITGVRRCGKSVLSFLIGSGKNFAYVNFEDERILLDSDELNKVLEAVYSIKKEPELFVFNEIQNIKGWEKFVNRLIQNKKIIITGSNANLLSKEFSTHLTGRHVDFLLFPFSFKEFLKLKKFKPNIYLTRDVAKIKNFLKKYSELGGFPLTHKIGKIFLIENYKDIIERDVIQRYKIKYVKTFKEISNYLISNYGNEISFNKIKKIFKIKSIHTVKNYVFFLQNTYLIFLINRFSFKLKEQNLAPKKVYCIDSGLINTIAFNASQNKGKIIENIVAIELLRRKKTNTEIYYWKNHQQKEVDFVLKEKNKIKQLIQVTVVSSEKELAERELNSLLKASDELKCNNLLIITNELEKEKKIKNKKIKFKPLWKWLLE